MRDQSARVYRAENQLIRQMKRIESLGRCRELIKGMTTGAWWGSHCKKIPAKAIKVTSGRHHPSVFVEPDLSREQRRGNRGTYLRVIRATIRLPERWRNLVTICHMLAHVSVASKHPDTPKHGKRFAREYLATVKKFLGNEIHDELLEYFREEHVKWGGGD